MGAAAHSNVIPFAFEDNLVRIVKRDDEPWFVGNDVCRALDIRNARDAMGRLDNDEKGVATTDTPGGPQEVIIVSEAGVFRLVFTSRKEEAERFKRWLAHEVLPTLRRTGRFDLDDTPPEAIGADPISVVTTKLALVREARMLFGHQQARAIWRQLALPSLPIDETETPRGEAGEVLWTILMAEASQGRSVRRLLLDAMEEDEIARATLKLCGIRQMDMDGEPGFWIANRAQFIAKCLEGTSWGRTMTWRIALKRLDGARSGGVHSTDGFAQAGVWLPERYLDFRSRDIDPT